MRCSNCDFENIPGMPRCVRCQSLLVLADVAVVPPRASALRWGTRWRSLWHRATAAARQLWQALPRRQPGDGAPVSWEGVVWSVVPGVGHIRYGNRLAGQLLLGLWLALLLSAVLTLGLDAFMWCVAGAAALHGTVILSFLRPVLAHRSVVGRALGGLLLFVAIGYTLYRPLVGLASQFYTPFPVMGLSAGDVIQNGDGLLCEGPWRRPEQFQRGDLVLYRINAGNAWHGNYGYAVGAGFGLDRVVGVPGDDVQLLDGAVRVNGQIVGGAQAPLGRLAALPGFQVRVEYGEYVIIPSRLGIAVHGNLPAGSILAQLSRVRDPEVLGRVVLRLRPWSRFGKVE